MRIKILLVFVHLVSVLYLLALSHSGFAADQDANAGVLTLNEAILFTLSDNPGIQIVEANVERAKAELQQGAGQFDWSFVASTSYGRTSTLNDPSNANPNINFSESIDSGGNFALKKLFRNGITIQPDLSVNRNKQGTVYDPLGTSNAAITVSVPLLKGSGKGAAGINEESLNANMEAEKYTRIYDVSNLVFNTVAAYWVTLSEQQSQIIVNKGLARGERNAKILRGLVNGGELPSSQLQRAIAEIDLSQLSAEARSEGLYTRYQELIVSMGGDATVAQPVASLSTALPDPLSSDLGYLPAYEQMLSVSFENRGDIIAAKHQIEANRLLTDQAKKNLLPTLDLSVGVGVIGANAGKEKLEPYNFPEHERSNTDYSIGLSFVMPFGNNVAKGELAKNRSSYRIAQENLRSLQITIQSDLSAVLNRIDSNRKRYKKAAHAINIYADLVKDGLEQVINGEQTFADLVDLEDRLTSAQLTGLDARTQFALALAELRIITGTAAQLEASTQKLLFSSQLFKSLPNADTTINNTLVK